ncbi:ROK family protein [Agreia pratensis]|uniref:ROK family protein n=1 Tax=Agreia pratensis TaxID=150121 RepID=UPI00188D95C2|nr:ROK family protein [Agreia pratensis]MBF4635300.1 ROK family protein [Agreia pratensis]
MDRVSSQALTYGQIINLVRVGGADTRPAIEQETRLGRKLVAQRVQQAIDVGLLEDYDFASSSGGRPSRRLRFRAAAGHVYAGVIGATEITAAVTTLDGQLVDSVHEDWDAADRPQETLEVLDGLFQKLARRTKTVPWAFGIGVGGPVEFGSGRLVAPPIMPGWNDVSVRGWLRERYDAPVWVDNDVNLMALGEWHKGEPRDGRDLLYFFGDEGVGAGLVSGGAVFRGASGAAGDLGHIQVAAGENLVCRCGLVGCLEAVAGGWGLAREATRRAAESPRLQAILAARGRLTSQDIGLAAAAGDELASELAVRAAHEFGEVAGSLINFVNPGTVVLGGGILRAGDLAIAEFWKTIRNRTSVLAARNLRMRTSSLGFREGVIGAALLAIEQLFAPGSLGVWIENGSPTGFAAPLHRLAS